MILTNVETVPGRTIVEHFGLVSGSTVRAKHVGKDIMASLKNIVGGELKGYTELLGEAREQSIQRMIQQAEQLGANAIVNVRFSTSSITQGAAEFADLHVQGWLGDVQGGRGGGEVAVLGEHGERAQRIGLQQVPPHHSS